jgi:hypothetical protein
LHQLTRSSYLWCHVLNAPLWGLYALIEFIFYKSLHATPLQLGFLISARPLAAIFSFYWSSFINQRSDRLKANIIGAQLCGLLPCFLFPFINHNGYVIFASMIFMFSMRAVIPAWMEILKINLPSNTRAQVFSQVSSIKYLADALAFIACCCLDIDATLWRWLYAGAAVLSLGGLYFVFRLDIPVSAPKEPESVNLKKFLVNPWQDLWKLMQDRPDFMHFQAIFWLGGLGLMVARPAVALFVTDVLQLSYTELGLAFTVCKTIGVACTSRFWAIWFNRLNIFVFILYVTLFSLLSSVLMICAQIHVAFLYLAYLIYGVMQAGSEIGWNLSGPLFSKENDSSPFSRVNVVMVGLRGCLGPSLGTSICVLASPVAAFGTWSFLSFCASFYALSYLRSAKKSLPEIAA